MKNIDVCSSASIFLENEYNHNVLKIGKILSNFRVSEYILAFFSPIMRYRRIFHVSLLQYAQH